MKKALTLQFGGRTSKIIILYMALSTIVLVLTIIKAPDQLANAGIAIASMGAGGAAYKFGNGYEAKHDGGQ